MTVAPTSGPSEAQRRSARLNALTPVQQEELFFIIGEAAVDLWIQGESWPTIVERCLDAIEEDDDPSRILVRRFGA